MKVEDNWEARSSYTNPDQPAFRTIGETVGKDIKDDQIKCLGADFKTVKTGKANCWPYWLEGANLVIGKKLDGSAYKQDRFVWLTMETRKCGKDGAGAEIVGLDCVIKEKIPCNAAKIARLGVGANSSSICIPTITW